MLEQIGDRACLRLEGILNPTLQLGDNHEGYGQFLLHGKAILAGDGRMHGRGVVEIRVALGEM